MNSSSTTSLEATTILTQGGDEINVYTDWTISKYVMLSAGYGVMFPGEGAVQGVGDDETFHLFEMGLYFTY